MKNYIYGVDLGGTNIKIGLFEVNPLKLKDKVSISTPTENQDEAIFDKIIETIEQMNKKRKITFDHVIGIGTAVPCPIIVGNISLCPNLTIRDLNIEDKLASRVPDHVLLASSNDANMAAYGEFMNAKENYNNAAFYTLGTGIGGGLIINRKMIEGKHGTAGEFGHMKVFEGLDELCGCGSNGCLEQLAGTKGLMEQARRHMVYESSILEDSELTIKRIFDAAKLGDAVAYKVVNKALEAMAVSASILAVTVDPDVFIIGGGVSNAGAFLIERLTYYYNKHARFNTGEIPFILAKLKNDAGMYGSAYHMFNRYEEISK